VITGPSRRFPVACAIAANVVQGSAMGIASVTT
jgi:hypothetical protein